MTAALVALALLVAVLVSAVFTRVPAGGSAGTTVDPMPSFTTEALPAPERLAVIGDSWAGAGVATVQAGTWPAEVARATGMSLEVFAEGGTGYTTRDPYLDRVAAVVASGPDVVVVQGSTNDKRSRETTNLAATAVFSQLRAQLPQARVYAVGPAATPGGMTRYATDARDGVAAAALANGVTFVDPLAEQWLPLDADVWADPFHLNQAGHRLFADRVSARLTA